MQTRLEMSKEAKNRLTVWYVCLQKGVDALVAADYYRTVPSELNENDFIEYRICNTNRTVAPSIVALSGLYTEALMLFAQIFTTGSAGLGFAKNKATEMDYLRNIIKTEVMALLVWDDSQYDLVCSTLMLKRDKFGAHYDGTHADYKENVENASFRTPGIWFDDIEYYNFKNLINTMYCVVRTILIYRS